MLWMQTYLFYCSVRLGVIVIGLLTLFQLLVPAVFLILNGIDLIEPIINLFRNDDYYKRNVIVAKLLKWIDEEPENFIITLNILLFSHIVTCILTMYGAFRLLKYLLVPFIVCELFRVVVGLTGHIILMIVLKKLINLGVLVAFTLLGGFFILYLAYNWCACVALYQIIGLINCKRYRTLYGDDPFSPNLLNTNNYPLNTIENVHVLTTPNFNEIDELKQKNYEALKFQHKAVQQKQGIIAVLPANYETPPQIPIMIGDTLRFKERSRKWWQDTKPIEMTTQNPLQEKQNFENNYSVNYNHWQWSEIMVPPGAKKRNKMIGLNYGWN